MLEQEAVLALAPAASVDVPPLRSGSVVQSSVPDGAASTMTWS